MDDVAGLMKTKGSKHLSEDVPSLGGDLQIANHVDGLTVVFLDKWDRFRPQWRSSRAKLG
jgi:hypothetical protein